MNFDPDRIILGCANLGGLFLDGEVPSIEKASKIVNAARELGIFRFDTAPLYGWGASEFYLGRALEELKISRGDIYLSSKCLRSLMPCIEGRDKTQPDFWTLGEPNCRFTHRWGVDYDSILQTLVRTLEVLRVSHLDGLSLHDVADAFDEVTSLTWASIEDVAKACRDLKDKGFVKEIGFGGKESERLKEIMTRHPGLLSYASTTTYNLIDQEFLNNGSFEACKKEDIEYRVAGPFCSRLLAEDPRTAQRKKGKDNQERLYYRGNVDSPVTFNYRYIDESQFRKACLLWDIVGRFGEANPRAAALQFVLSHPGVASIIVGAASPEHLHELKASIEKGINPALWVALKAEGIIAESAPTPE